MFIQRRRGVFIKDAFLGHREETRARSGWLAGELLGATRWIRVHQATRVRRGRMGVFVDDMFGVCWAEDLEHDMRAAAAL